MALQTLITLLLIGFATAIVWRRFRQMFSKSSPSGCGSCSGCSGGDPAAGIFKIFPFQEKPHLTRCASYPSVHLINGHIFIKPDGMPEDFLLPGMHHWVRPGIRT